MDEAEGLYAYAVVVRANAGVGFDVRPESIEFGDAGLAVTTIVTTWREEDRVGFRVQLEDGAIWLLYYVPELDLWSGFADAGVGSATVEPRRSGRPLAAGDT